MNPSWLQLLCLRPQSMAVSVKAVRATPAGGSNLPRAITTRHTQSDTSGFCNAAMCAHLRGVPNDEALAAGELQRHVELAAGVVLVVAAGELLLAVRPVPHHAHAVPTPTNEQPSSYP